MGHSPAGVERGRQYVSRIGGDMRWFTLGFLFVASLATAQQPSNAPPIRWQQSYGGTDGEHLTTVAELRDGSFIMSGYSFSGVSGNKTNDGGSSGWLVFTDSL